MKLGEVPAYVSALRAFYSAPQRERYAASTASGKGFAIGPRRLAAASTYTHGDG
jgi:hypothetical protein